MGEQKKKLGEQEKKLGEQEKKLGEQGKKLGEQEKKLGEQEKKLGEQEKKLGEQEKKLGDQGKKLGEHEKKLGVKEKKFGEQEKKLEMHNDVIVEQHEKIQAQELKLHKLELKLKLPSVMQCSGYAMGAVPSENFKEEMKSIVDPLKEFVLRRCFFMKNFSKEMEDRTRWMSHVMYTHLHGYKFCIGINAYGEGVSRGKAVLLEFWPHKGEYDFQLPWPAMATITIHLISQVGGINWHSTNTISWNEPEECKRYYYNLGNLKFRSENVFIHHNKLKSYLNYDDTLFFRIVDITIHED